MITGLTLGFTGTRQGMTAQQKKTCAALIEQYDPYKVIHGMAIGADREFHDLATDSLSLIARIVGYPSNIPSQTSPCHDGCDYTEDPKPPLDRNRDIVDHCDILIAAPAEATEQRRGGTWYTIRYAKKLGKHTIIILPDGQVERFNRPG